MLNFKDFISEGNKRLNRRAWKSIPGEPGEVAPFYAGKKIFFNRRQRNSEKFSKSNQIGMRGVDAAKSSHYGKDSRLRAAIRGVHPYVGSRAKPPKLK